MSTELKDTAEGLDHLIIIANDGKKGYAQAADIANDPMLKAMFTRYSAERAEFVEQLQTLVASIGKTPAKGGGPLGALHRVWTDIKASVVTNDDLTTLKECIDGDETALSAYRYVLDEHALTPAQADILKAQVELINDALFSLKQELDKERTA